MSKNVVAKLLNLQQNYVKKKFNQTFFLNQDVNAFYLNNFKIIIKHVQSNKAILRADQKNLKI